MGKTVVSESCYAIINERLNNSRLINACYKMHIICAFLQHLGSKNKDLFKKITRITKKQSRRELWILLYVTINEMDDHSSVVQCSLQSMLLFFHKLVNKLESIA
jgi:hypothetical protein